MNEFITFTKIVFIEIFLNKVFYINNVILRNQHHYKQILIVCENNIQ